MMNINFNKNDLRKVLTVAEFDIAKQIVKGYKSSEETIEDYIRTAISSIPNVGTLVNIYHAEASIVRDETSTYNGFSDESGWVNVWIEGVVQCSDCFMKLGFLMTEVWKLCGDSPIRCFSQLYRPTHEAWQ